MKKFFLSLVVAAMLVACCKAPEVGYQPDKSVCVGANSLTLVNVGPTKVLTRDFVVDPSRVDSVWLAAVLPRYSLKTKLSSKKELVTHLR